MAISVVTQLSIFEETIEDKIAKPESVGNNANDEDNVENENDKFHYFKELGKTPMIEQVVYTHLPELLKVACSQFRNARERDVFLTAALCVLSGIFSKVKGRYDGKIVYTPLYSFVIAPAASDKNALVFAKQLGIHIHKRHLQENKIKFRIYELKKKEKSENADENVSKEANPKPKHKILFIPANSSSASIISHLEESDEIGIIVETEADTMAIIFKQDWGGYSDLLRKAFHHESISYSRKRENEFIEINTPRLAIAIAGTPSQVGGLIKSASDGLFSRYIFYTYSVKQEWRDVSSANKNDLTTYFESIGEPIMAIYDMLEKFDYEFELQESHWKLLNGQFRNLLKQTDRLTGKESPSTVKRLGLITYRIAMVFTILRQFEKGIPDPQLICDDTDFGNAMLMTRVYFQHSLFMLETLNNTDSNDKPSSIPITKFYNALKRNKIFKRHELLEIGKRLNFKERSIDAYLKTLVDKNLLHKTRTYGEYCKP